MVEINVIKLAMKLAFTVDVLTTLITNVSVNLDGQGQIAVKTVGVIIIQRALMESVFVTTVRITQKEHFVKNASGGATVMLL